MKAFATDADEIAHLRRQRNELQTTSSAAVLRARDAEDTLKRYLEEDSKWADEALKHRDVLRKIAGLALSAIGGHGE